MGRSDDFVYSLPHQKLSESPVMTMNVKIDLGYEFDVKANASDVFAVLSDVPTSASFFPKVDKWVDLIPITH